MITIRFRYAYPKHRYAALYSRYDIIELYFINASADDAWAAKSRVNQSDRGLR